MYKKFNTAPSLNGVPSAFTIDEKRPVQLHGISNRPGSSGTVVDIHARRTSSGSSIKPEHRRIQLEAVRVPRDPAFIRSLSGSRMALRIPMFRSR
jgi:hypothetical protein